ncbi:tetratricopeptide repeat protein [Cellulomonas sp. P24]|uniref:tetratricopeptide repeat protein n=1 Tax=Cellulomonas sp. P24 TaxID=2885206 RepID=UPI00216B349E|nr:tetratricopeptide repeat protein [Cellulomonas sp. P24]MCR6492583.1 tetratricopeptide repeat protein [Cellulomonas sp. P24]
MTDTTWEQRVADLWAAADRYPEAELRELMEGLVAELPDGSPIAAYERGSVWDSTGHPDRAVPLYRDALANGLSGRRRREAVIQLASSLRNLGQADESVALLTAEAAAGSDGLDDAVDAFLALALVDTGREREAVAVALTALSRHLTRFQRSLVAYTRELTDTSDD